MKRSIATSSNRRTLKTTTARKSLVLALAVGFSTATMAQSNSPWLPIPSGGSISLTDVSQSGEAAYVMGGTLVPIVGITGGAATRYKRETIGLKVSYGVADMVSVDASIASGKVRVGNADNSSGLTDTVIGVNWRVLDEYEKRGLPTVTLRLAGIINGNYDGARLAALGKDASGYELSVLVGKQISPAFSVWGGVGIEDRSNGVPTATFFDVNAGFSPLPALSLTLGYSSKKYGGSLDIAGPGFSPAAFQRVREQRDTVRIGASYAIAGNHSIAVSLGKTVSGRNTVKDDRIIGLGYTFGF